MPDLSSLDLRHRLLDRADRLEDEAIVSEWTLLDEEEAALLRRRAERIRRVVGRYESPLLPLEAPDA